MEQNFQNINRQFFIVQIQTLKMKLVRQEILLLITLHKAFETLHFIHPYLTKNRSTMDINNPITNKSREKPGSIWTQTCLWHQSWTIHFRWKDCWSPRCRRFTLISSASGSDRPDSKKHKGVDFMINNLKKSLWNALWIW